MKTRFPALRTFSAALASCLSILTAHAAETTFTYYRFTPIELRDDANADSVQLSEFEFALDTEVVDLSGAIITNPGGDNPEDEGVDNISDLSTGSKWLDFERGPLVFQFQAPTTIDRYRFATANDADERDPIRWQLEGSDDGTSWLVIDERDSEFVPTDRETFTASFIIPTSLEFNILEFSSVRAVLINGGSTSLQWDVINADTRQINQGIGNVTPIGTQPVSPPADSDTNYVLTAGKDAATLTRSLTIRTVAGGTSNYRYVRFSPRKLRDNAQANSTQLAELRFFLSTTPVPVVAVTNPGGDNPQNEAPANVIDGNVGSKWLDFNKGNLVLDFGATVAFDRYELTTAFDAPERDPVRWIMEGSTDGLAWTLIENFTVFDFPTPLARETATQVIPLPGSSLIALPPAPPLVITASTLNFDDQQATLTFTSHESRSYRVTASDDLGDWTTVLEGGIPGASGQATTTVTTPFTPATRGFLRVEEQ